MGWIHHLPVEKFCANIFWRWRVRSALLPLQVRPLSNQIHFLLAIFKSIFYVCLGNILTHLNGLQSPHSSLAHWCGRYWTVKTNSLHMEEFLVYQLSQVTLHLLTLKSRFESFFKCSINLSKYRLFVYSTRTLRFSFELERPWVRPALWNWEIEQACGHLHFCDVVIKILADYRK